MTRSSTRVSRTWGPLLLGALVTALLLVVWSQVVAPQFPADPTRHHFRPIRTFWIGDQRRPLFSFEDPETAELLVIGDSRSQRAVVAATLEAHGLGETAVLARGGARLVDLLEAAREFPARRLVVALSPYAVFEREVWDERGTQPARGPLTPQARVDRWLNERTGEVRHELVRTVDPALWRRQWLPERTDVLAPEGYKMLMHVEDREANRAGLEHVISLIVQLESEGWDILCVRIPITPELLAVEDRGLPGEWIAEACERAGLRYLDLVAVPHVTDDGSHMTGPSADVFSELLATEIERATGW